MTKAAIKILTETQVSAGGAVTRSRGDDVEVALISVGSPARWQLPKGLIDPADVVTRGRWSSFRALSKANDTTSLVSVETKRRGDER